MELTNQERTIVECTSAIRDILMRYLGYDGVLSVFDYLHRIEVAASDEEELP